MEVKTLKHTKAEYNILENATVLNNELNWLEAVINVRVALHFNHETIYNDISEISVPDVEHYNTPYTNFIIEHQLSFEERLVLILALMPHLKPALLDLLSTKNKEYDRRFSEFGGIFLEQHSGLIPTAETAMFILAGDNIEKRLHYQYIFQSNFVLLRKSVIKAVSTKDSKPLLSTIWLIANEYLPHVLNGEKFTTTHSTDFPAQLITTSLAWQDLVVSRSTAKGLQEIRDWLTHGHTILNDLDLRKRLKPGYKSLFYGLPGTGKSMAASLLGKSTNQQVYKIDLSMTVSKYIGETEKNLAKVFDEAERHNWILFFDEADSLFGKRTQVNSANDRYGNQEIGYLLQRIEDFSGVVILASNLKDNIDDAFSRRFQSMIEFKMPSVQERYTLWKQSFSKKLPLHEHIDLWRIAEKYQISGGLMMNVIRKCTLEAVTKQQVTIQQENLEKAIKLELQKEGILLS